MGSRGSAQQSLRCHFNSRASCGWWHSARLFDSQVPSHPWPASRICGHPPTEPALWGLCLAWEKPAKLGHGQHRISWNRVHPLKRHFPKSSQSLSSTEKCDDCCLWTRLVDGSTLRHNVKAWSWVIIKNMTTPKKRCHKVVIKHYLSQNEPPQLISTVSWQQKATRWLQSTLFFFPVKILIWHQQKNAEKWHKMTGKCYFNTIQCIFIFYCAFTTATMVTCKWTYATHFNKVA